MKASLFPILSELRQIYDEEGAMSRFQAYRSLMLDTKNEILPLGAFSPMGENQADYLDILIQMNAESIALDAAESASGRLTDIHGHCRVILVVLDEAKNGWTQRYLTDAEWRFTGKYDDVTDSSEAKTSAKWVTVQLWTDVAPTEGYILQETGASIFRAAHKSQFGSPNNLTEMIAQEGRAAAFSGKLTEMTTSELGQANEQLKPYEKCTDMSTCYSVLYGDEVAESLGYPPLGFSSFFGFKVGLARALSEAG